ncbi:HRDC domain-containing protein [Gorillibacterium sp. sgz500922]|uniref:HRDC domain-containing protein n=1 Tax=Gorillibacterium sp. sgz500922 TaxID=3446694 RepID=UPI003F67C58C
MSLVFLNSFERTGDAGEKEQARLGIQQAEEGWQIWWSCGEGEEATEEMWFEGASWMQLMDRFRLGLKTKQSEGYAPLIETLAEEKGFVFSRRVQLLYCYSEHHYRPDAFERLRLWRREHAKQEGKSAYIIASNRMLQMISAFLPQTPEELAQIPGIGDNRLKAYGAEILAITGEYAPETPFPLDWVAAAVHPDDFAAWQVLTERERFRQQADRLEHRKQIMDRLAQGDGLGELAKALKTSRRDILNHLEELNREGCDMDRLLETELAHVKPELREMAEQLFCELGDRYLRPVVNRLMPAAEAGSKEVEQTYEWLRLERICHRRRLKEGEELVSVSESRA